MIKITFSRVFGLVWLSLQFNVAVYGAFEVTVKGQPANQACPNPIAIPDITISVDDTDSVDAINEKAGVALLGSTLLVT